jgi:hypothetical protein
MQKLINYVVFPNWKLIDFAVSPVAGSMETTVCEIYHSKARDKYKIKTKGAVPSYPEGSKAYIECLSKVKMLNKEKP